MRYSTIKVVLQRMAEQEKWQWQEPGTAWKGAGLYHITLTIPSREPLLGTLAIPNNDPTMAKVYRTALGNALVNCLLGIPYYHPEVQVLHFCLMPDHLHAVLYVRQRMEKGIKTLVRGFWQGTKKLGRAHSAAASIAPSVSSSSVAPISSSVSMASSVAPISSSVTPNIIRENTQEGRLQHETSQLEQLSAVLCKEIGTEAYYRLEPVFTEMPFIRPMGRRSQLPNTIRYIDMNPQRLATKRLKPGLFRVQKDIEIAGRRYDGVGNTTLLMAKHFQPVHVRHELLDEAARGDNQPLRNYMNGCILAARQGTVMVSPFISPKEKEVQTVLLAEKHSFILLADNGFREYYKPSDSLFDACASGRVLILSPWPYDEGKRHITRSECIALNAMAEEICHHLSNL